MWVIFSFALGECGLFSGWLRKHFCALHQKLANSGKINATVPIIDLGHGGSAGIATWREGNVLPREPATTKQVLLVLFFSVFDLLRKNHRKVVVCPPQ